MKALSVNSFRSYFLLMLIALAIKTYFLNFIAVVWIINFLGLYICFGNSFIHPSKKIISMGLFYICCGIATVAVNADSIDWGLKAVGININILVVPLFWLICAQENTIKRWNTQNLQKFLLFISSLGLISILYAWFVDTSTLLAIMHGASAYSVKSYGFFPHKNIYGAFVALTTVADLLLYGKTGHWKYLILIGIKMLAVIFSFSRAALLFLILTYIVFALLGLRNKNTLKLCVIFGCIGIMLGILMLGYEPSIQFTRNQVLRMEIGDTGRLNAIESSLGKFGSSPWHILFGVGYFNLDFLNIDIDNTYLYLLFSGGIVKIIIYLIAYLIVLHQIWWLRRQNIVLGNMCLAVSIGYLAFSFFESVALFELGLLNFMFGLWIYLIPFGYNVNSGEIKYREDRLLVL